MTEERRRQESYHTYFSEKYWQKQHLVLPGHFLFSDSADEILVAETGAGVIVCIYDMEAHIGGLAHIFIPEVLIKDFKDLKKHKAQIVKHAKAPLEGLIHALKHNGAGKKRINIRLSGGTSMMNDEFDMGLKNAVFAQNEILEKGLNLVTRDIGGENCRRIHFFPYTGRMEKYQLRRDEDKGDLWMREQDYLKHVRDKFGNLDEPTDN